MHLIFKKNNFFTFVDTEKNNRIRRKKKNRLPKFHVSHCSDLNLGRALNTHVGIGWMITMQGLAKLFCRC